MTRKFQELDRLVIPQLFLAGHISTIEHFFARKITNLAFNLDKVRAGDLGIALK
jgi:hypothetical protein